MDRVRLALLACAAAACASYPVRPPQPPPDAEARRHAEVDACWRGTWPPWLGDEALAAAGSLDGREAQASSANEAFRGATYASPPVGSLATGARVRAIVQEREQFERACASLRSGGKPGATP